MSQKKTKQLKTEIPIAFPCVTWKTKEMKRLIKCLGVEKAIKEISRILGDKKHIREMVEEYAKL